jgi:hypothetical protein
MRGEKKLQQIYTFIFAAILFSGQHSIYLYACFIHSSTTKLISQPPIEKSPRPNIISSTVRSRIISTKVVVCAKKKEVEFVSRLS